MRVASGSHIRFENIKNFVVWKFKRCLNIYRCLWLQIVNKVEMEQIILFMKIVNRWSERKERFLGAPVPKFWRGLCVNQGYKNFVLVSCLFKAYCKLHRLLFTWPFSSMSELSVRFEVDVSLLLAPAGADKRGPKVPFPVVETAGIQPAIRNRVPAGAPAGAGSFWKRWMYTFLMEFFTVASLLLIFYLLYGF